MKHLHFSVFLNQVNRHGGVRRSEQLSEALKKIGFESINPYIATKKAFLVAIKNPFIFLNALICSFYLLMFRGLSIKGFFSFSLQASNIAKLLDSIDYDLIILETAPGVSLFLMHYLRFRKIKFIAVPHNIEFLVPGQVDPIFRNQKSAFQVEIEGYRYAEKVISICEYDASILRSAGLSVEVFKYFPTENDYKFFNDIAKDRLNKDKQYFLMLGTVGNTPTLNGMIELLMYLKQNPLRIPIRVAGFGTEQLLSYGDSNVQILGAVDEDVLRNLLLECKAILINQPQTTGFLTKIVEMNIASIPQIILSNYHQARGMENFGIYCYSITDLDVFSDLERKIDMFVAPSLDLNLSDNF